MKKRGKVLRVPRGGPGLLMIEGRQFPFSLDDVWKSELPPRPGLLVNVEFDEGLRITAIAAVADLSSTNFAAQAARDNFQTTGSSRLAKFLGRIFVSGESR